MDTPDISNSLKVIAPIKEVWQNDKNIQNINEESEENVDLNTLKNSLEQDIVVNRRKSSLSSTNTNNDANNNISELNGKLSKKLSLESLSSSTSSNKFENEKLDMINNKTHKREDSDVILDFDSIASDNLYPKKVGLPWHTCWIDDGMIGGCSLPLVSFHYKSLANEGVGLIVNLTEQPISRAVNPIEVDYIRKDILHSYEPRTCASCEFTEESCPIDVFDMLAGHDDVDVLFLPLADGSIPAYSQLKLFVNKSKKYIESGKKVMVHCQAGVGRTGIFLAVYLMEKYRCMPNEAIKILRFCRPQSMRFHKTEWVEKPFIQFSEDEYSRNYLQERFIFRYWKEFICNDMSELVEAERRFNFELKPPMECVLDIYLQLKDQGRFVEGAEQNPKVLLENEEITLIINDLVTEELDIKIKKYNEFENNPMNIIEEITENQRKNIWKCSACLGIQSIGPANISSGSFWPSNDVPIYMHSGDIVETDISRLSEANIENESVDEIEEPVKHDEKVEQDEKKDEDRPMSISLFDEEHDGEDLKFINEMNKVKQYKSTHNNDRRPSNCSSCIRLNTSMNDTYIDIVSPLSATPITPTA